LWRCSTQTDTLISNFSIHFKKSSYFLTLLYSSLNHGVRNPLAPSYSRIWMGDYSVDCSP
jgi:hypothetical protein